MYQRPYRVDLEHRGHSTVKEYSTGRSSPNPGVSALTPISFDAHPRFLSGGEDGTIRVWAITQVGSTLEATSEHLELSPTHPVRCLAYRPSDDQVFVCHTRHIYSAHLEAPKPPPAMRLSATPLQVHVHPQNPQVVILEVST